MDAPYDPGIYGPVVGSIDVFFLVTYFNSTKSVEVDVAEDAKHVFEKNIWILFSIFCLSFMTSFILIHKLMGDDSYLLDSIWHIICIILRNFDFNSRTHSKLLYFIFILFMFFIITIFLNMFAASLIVNPRSDYVEKFAEIPKRNLTPFFVYDHPYWKPFSDAESGPYKEVWDVCRQIGTEKCFFRNDVNDAEYIASLVRREDLAFFCSSDWTYSIYPMIKSMLKIHVHVAEERMKPTLYAILYSKNISIEKRRILDEK